MGVKLGLSHSWNDIAEGVRGQGAEGDICSKVGRGDRRLHNGKLHGLHSTLNI